MPRNSIRIATRSSNLALWQAKFVRSALQAQYPDIELQLVEIVSTGDVVRDRPLYEVGSVGLFTKEVQEAVLAGSADLAVHSLKDLPTQMHPKLCLAAVPKRGPVGDALLSPEYRTLDRLPVGAKVATSSLRRRAQILRYRPDLCIVDIRGNVETRIRKLHEQQLDGLILAIAGLERMKLTAEITERFSTEIVLPAVGQGAMGVECRQDDVWLQEILASLEHRPTRQAVDAERAFLHTLEGGCQVPIGALTKIHTEDLELEGIALSPDGKQMVQGTIRGPAKDAKRLGSELADRLLSRGGREIMDYES